MQVVDFRKRSNLRARGQSLKTLPAQIKLKTESSQSLLHTHFNLYLQWVYKNILREDATLREMKAEGRFPVQSMFNTTQSTC